ncbi:hypothetical protein EZJ49_10095 [Bdellovibrio bacteriovorus]|uniref:hypothetical protein n=1 Tax=Bdellovibrio bacteriovorus TaxID=959 RepID=UPI0021D05BEC|nr:hypothetical protein [Bdellovibrio bacteriovorus]UXR63425.1 hypothetical protein EZJ49_10095 [Bdellovibrio bacteriovorus]
MKNSALSTMALVFLALPAFASQELKNLIACHEALDGKSEARTQKLNLESPTPFVLNANKKLYFFTDTSVGVLPNTYANKSLVVQLTEKQKPFYRALQFQKNGDVGNISFQDVTAEQKATSEAPKAQLDESSLKILKKELLRQMNSVTGEYQNKYDPSGTIESLNICRKVDLPEMQKSIDKQVAFYEKLVKNKKSSGGYRKAPGVK